MKMQRSLLIGLVAGFSALAFTSCAYDPYYAEGSGGSYGGGYGDGYGYGSSGFSTSYFVSTGSSRWAYDPYAGAYFDYTRHCYYDPYLSGYYPVGYRPRYVVGSPHPHGWSRGSNYCAPPSNVRVYNLTNYRDRNERYRSLGRSWSSNVSVNTSGGSRGSSYGSQNSYGNRPNSTSGSSRYQGSTYPSRSGNTGSFFGNSSQNRSNTGRSNGTSGVFTNQRESGNRPGFAPQTSGSVRPDFRVRDSSSNPNAGRVRSAPQFAPQPSVDRGRSNQGYTPTVRPQAPRVAPQPTEDHSRGNRGFTPPTRSQAPSMVPQIHRGGESPGGNRGRDNSDRDKDKGIRGLGQG